MSLGGRAQARQRMLRRAALIAAVLLLLALIFLASGHWILAIVFGLAAAAAIWALLQLRTVR
jgi:uncharacterized membrane protein